MCAGHMPVLPYINACEKYKYESQDCHRTVLDLEHRKQQATSSPDGNNDSMIQGT